MGRKLELAIAALNGAVGDYLARTGNGLATAMTLVHDGQPLPLSRAALAGAHPEAEARRRVALLVHGLGCSEDVWRFPEGGDYGSRLASDLGYTPLYLRYNSGRAIADNGRDLAGLLERLLEVYPAPVEELLLIGFSLGGLVVRSACYVGSCRRRPWLGLMRRAIYVGTPHRGAPLERWGRTLTRLLDATGDPYAQLAAQLSELRSVGVKDLGDPTPLPLLPQIRHHLVAGTLLEDPLWMSLLGDVMVPVPSATDGRHSRAKTTANAETTAGVKSTASVKIVPGVGHIRLAHHPEVYQQIRAWCEDTT